MATPTVVILRCALLRASKDGPQACPNPILRGFSLRCDASQASHLRMTAEWLAARWTIAKS
uniref:Uncharacterized protein n=1 Tax=Bradyrhizobium amphicarpaeae TaxID=1404768 RepID=A0A2U8PUE9_9BRAD|nr:hypothetical protein CIT40_15165 [Bradyrhizobium amphicarpaeae]